jgi:hypothetical protein
MPQRFRAGSLTSSELVEVFQRCRHAMQTWPRGDSRKAAGVSGFCGLSGASQSAPAHGRTSVVASKGRRDISEL